MLLEIIDYSKSNSRTVWLQVKRCIQFFTNLKGLQKSWLYKHSDARPDPDFTAIEQLVRQVARFRILIILRIPLSETLLVAETSANLMTWILAI